MPLVDLLMLVISCCLLTSCCQSITSCCLVTSCYLMNSCCLMTNYCLFYYLLPGGKLLPIEQAAGLKNSCFLMIAAAEN